MAKPRRTYVDVKRRCPALPYLFLHLYSLFQPAYNLSGHALDVLVLMALDTLWLCRCSMSGSFVAILALKRECEHNGTLQRRGHIVDGSRGIKRFVFPILCGPDQQLFWLS